MKPGKHQQLHPNTSPGSDRPEISGSKSRVISAIIILSSFSSAFLGTAITVVIPDMSGDLSISAAGAGWLITVYALTTCALSVPFGKLADATGRNRIFILGLTILFTTCLGAGFVRAFPLMILMRILQGVGASMIFATNTAIIVANHPPNQRGRAIGKMLSGTYVGLASGPVISGVLNYWLGWNSIFFVSALVALTSLLPSLRFLPLKETPAEGSGSSASADITGCILFILMISTMMFGFASVGTGWWPFALMGCGLILGLLFVRTELRSGDPIIDVRIFRSTPAYTLSNLAALFNYAATFGISYFMSLYLQVDKGYPSQTAGLILICQPLVMALLTSRAGSLSDRIPPYKLASAGMAICGCCLVFFALVTGGTPILAIICVLLCTGLGVACFSSPNMNAIMSCVDRAHYGVASSVLATMRTLGQTSGIAITTIVVQSLLGSASLEEAPIQDFESAMHISFWIFAGICFVGTLMSLKRKDT